MAFRPNDLQKKASPTIILQIAGEGLHKQIEYLPWEWSRWSIRSIPWTLQDDISWFALDIRQQELDVSQRSNAFQGWLWGPWQHQELPLLGLICRKPTPRNPCLLWQRFGFCLSWALGSFPCLHEEISHNLFTDLQITRGCEGVFPVILLYCLDGQVRYWSLRCSNSQALTIIETINKGNLMSITSHKICMSVQINTWYYCYLGRSAWWSDNKYPGQFHLHCFTKIWSFCCIEEHCKYWNFCYQRRRILSKASPAIQHSSTNWI